MNHKLVHHNRTSIKAQKQQAIRLCDRYGCGLFLRHSFWWVGDAATKLRRRSRQGQGGVLEEKASARVIRRYPLRPEIITKPQTQSVDRRKEPLDDRSLSCPDIYWEASRKDDAEMEPSHVVMEPARIRASQTHLWSCQARPRTGVPASSRVVRWRSDAQGWKSLTRRPRNRPQGPQSATQ